MASSMQRTRSSNVILPLLLLLALTLVLASTHQVEARPVGGFMRAFSASRRLLAIEDAPTMEVVDEEEDGGAGSGDYDDVEFVPGDETFADRGDNSGSDEDFDLNAEDVVVKEDAKANTSKQEDIQSVVNAPSDTPIPTQPTPMAQHPNELNIGKQNLAEAVLEQANVGRRQAEMASEVAAVLEHRQQTVREQLAAAQDLLRAQREKYNLLMQEHSHRLSKPTIVGGERAAGELR